MHPASFLLNALLFSFLLGSCQSSPVEPPPRAEEAKDPTASSAVRVTAEEHGPGEASKDVFSQPAEKGMLPLKKDPGPIVNGGCRDLCGDPKNALRNWLSYLLVAGVGGPDLTYRNFMDTSTLVDNDRHLGKRWETQWLEGRFDERQEEVNAWFLAYEARIAGNLDPESLRSVLEESLSFHRISSRLVAMEFDLPPIPGSTTGTHWEIQMSLRGLEWLVSSIKDD